MLCMNGCYLHIKISANFIFLKKAEMTSVITKTCYSTITLYELSYPIYFGTHITAVRKFYLELYVTYNFLHLPVTLFIV